MNYVFLIFVQLRIVTQNLLCNNIRMMLCNTHTLYGTHSPFQYCFEALDGLVITVHALKNNALKHCDHTEIISIEEVGSLGEENQCVDTLAQAC